MADTDPAPNSSAKNAVSNWLESIKLEEYYSAFEDQGYEDMSLLLNLSDDEVKDLFQNVGITKHGHILKIKKSLYGLQNQQMKEIPEKKATCRPVQSSKW